VSAAHDGNCIVWSRHCWSRWAHVHNCHIGVHGHSHGGFRCRGRAAGSSAPGCTLNAARRFPAAPATPARLSSVACLAHSTPCLCRHAGCGRSQPCCRWRRAAVHKPAAAWRPANGRHCRSSCWLGHVANAAAGSALFSSGPRTVPGTNPWPLAACSCPSGNAAKRRAVALRQPQATTASVLTAPAAGAAATSNCSAGCGAGQGR
jgi:hypothetical protein